MKDHNQCAQHPNHIAAVQRRIEKQHIQSEKRKQVYIDNPKLCVNCNNSILYEKRANKFCSSTCSAVYNNKKRSPVSKSHKLATSISQKQRHLLSGNAYSKLYYCTACGNIHQSSKKRKLCICGLFNKSASFKGLHTYFKLKLDNLGTAQFIYDYNICARYIKELYSNNSLLSLAKMINHPDVTGGNVGKILLSVGIELDTRSYANLKSATQGRYILGQGTNQRYKNGYIELEGKSHFYRSSYELKLINILHELNIPFDLELLTIIYQDTVLDRIRYAIPDFILPNNIIIEVKSNYTLDISNMRDKFNQYLVDGYQPYLWLEFKWYQLSERGFIEVQEGLTEVVNKCVVS